MSAINVSAKPIDLSQVKRLDLQTSARQLTPEESARFRNIAEQALQLEYSHIEGPSDTAYAEVKVGGKTVATLMNSGAMITGNADHARLQNLPSVKDSQQVGPALAKERAEEIARVLGGKVVMADTAMTQGKWEAQSKQQLVTDWDALRRDARLAGVVRSDVLITAQLLGEQA